MFCKDAIGAFVKIKFGGGAGMKRLVIAFLGNETLSVYVHKCCQ